MSSQLQSDLDLLSQGEDSPQKLTEDIQVKITALRDSFKKEDDPVRFKQLRQWKKLELYWDNIQNIFFSDVATNWQIPQSLTNISNEADIDPEIFDKVIGIYRAHGESIIAALAAAIPSTRFFPDDADDPMDLETANVATDISKLIEKHNDSTLLVLRILYLYFNFGCLFAHTYHHKSPEYGVDKIPVIGSKSVSKTSDFCPECGSDITDQPSITPNSDLGNETQDNTGDGFSQEGTLAEGQNTQNQEFTPEGTINENQASAEAQSQPQKQCLNCNKAVDYYSSTEDSIIPIITGYDESPKGREKIEVWGPLNVRVPNYIRKQSETPYLALEYEMHYTLARYKYPEIADKISGSSILEPYDRWARTPVQFGINVNTGLVTNSSWWFRPWTYTFFEITDPDIYKFLSKNYPKGFVATWINDEFADIEPEELDDAWTSYESPVSPSIHSVPPGSTLVPVQDGTNDLYNLKLQAVELSIPETLADPAVLNFNEYNKHRSEPGTIIPAKAQPGKNLADSFYTLKTATVSKELDDFSANLDEMAQFLSGDFPSLYGGTQQGGSKTLGEYTASRNQAIQRQSIPWKAIISLWAQMLKKSVKSYINHAAGDTHYVERKGNNYVNTWIKMSQLQGKIGDVEPEVSEQFPTTWPMKSQKLFDLIQLNNPYVGEVLQAPENIEFVKQTLGLPELYIPGTDDREYQQFEIEEMLKGQGATQVLGQVDPMTGQAGPPIMQSSIPVAPFENHTVHATVTRDWLVSSKGRYIKQTAPQIYQDIVAHWQEHMEALSQQAMQQGQPQQQTGNQGQQAAQSQTQDQGATQ